MAVSFCKTDATARSTPGLASADAEAETSVDEFLASLADKVRSDMVAVDEVLASAFAADERVLWEGPFWGGTQQHIIGYGSYHYRGRSGAEGEWFVIGLAAQKNYLSLYVNAADDGASIGERYADRLGKVKAKRANVQFKRASDLDLDVLRELATRARELAPTT